MQDILTGIGRQFCLPGTVSSYDTVKNGNINQTYKVTYRTDSGEKTYIFQKVNTHVFRNPEEIMENIGRVTAHIRRKCPDRPTLFFHRTFPSGSPATFPSGSPATFPAGSPATFPAGSPSDGMNFVYDADGGFWRVMDYLDSVVFDSCDDPSVIRAAGKAFGEFQRQLSDFDGSLLHETIPDFHNTRRRLDTLFADARRDIAGRTSDVLPELRRFRTYYKEATALCDRFAAGKFPPRVTHNDTKANNVLFDRETLRPLAVIDLDTVMPGMAMYDFGDAVRFLANTAAEDEPETEKVSLDVGKFTAFAEGFIGEVKDSLTPEEIDGMVQGAFSVTVELAARFLDDYLTGDVYFRTEYPEHNLVRARCQLRLAEDILSKTPQLQQIVRKIG